MSIDKKGFFTILYNIDIKAFKIFPVAKYFPPVAIQLRITTSLALYCTTKKIWPDLNNTRTFTGKQLKFYNAPTFLELNASIANFGIG